MEFRGSIRKVGTRYRRSLIDFREATATVFKNPVFKEQKWGIMYKNPQSVNVQITFVF